MDSSLQLVGYTWINFSKSVKHVREPKPSGGVGLFIKQSSLQEYSVSTLDKNVDGILIAQFNDNWKRSSRTPRPGFRQYECYRQKFVNSEARQGDSLSPTLFNVIYC